MVQKDKPNFFDWAFNNNLTVFMILLLLLISLFFRYISVPDIQTVEGTIVYGTKLVFSWLRVIKIFVLSFVGYGILRGLFYYVNFIMKDDD